MPSLRHRAFSTVVEEVTKRRARNAWMGSLAVRHERAGVPIPCPHCGGESGEEVFRLPLNSPVHLGMFDDDHRRLASIYALWLRPFVPARLFPYVAQTSLATVTGMAHLTYRRCTTCDLVYQDFPHRAEALATFYETYYRVPYDAPGTEPGLYGRDDPSFVRGKHLIASYLLERTGLPPGARVLDVGCAEGHVCAALSKAGVEAHGIEPSRPMVEYGRRVLGLDALVAGSYDETSYPDTSFDAVVNHHVLEHVLETRSFLGSMVADLKVGGWLLIQTPCLDEVATTSDERQVFRHDHLFGFSEKVLRRLFEEFPLEIQEIRRTPGDLSSMPPEEASPEGVSAWGDAPCGISILARRTS